MKTKVIICGSRDWKDGERIRRVILELIAQYGPFILIHGDARGADKLAARIAEGLGLEVEAYPADWKVHSSTCRCRPGAPYCKQAGFRRNSLMADQEPDLVVAFQLRQSTGTQMMIDIAGERGIRCSVYQAA